MAKRFPEQLRDLSVRAKRIEYAYDAAQKEAHEKFMARREQARTTAIAAVERVNQEVKSIQGTVGRNWNAVQTKIAACFLPLNLP
jgi:vacuolar-type H+-ATPase subunit H